MEYGIGSLSVIPLRGEPSERAEMVSQLLFGDLYTVIEKRDDWMKIRTCDCGYEGWIGTRSFSPMHKTEAEIYYDHSHYLVQDLLFFIRNFENGITFPVFIGSSFPYPQNNLLILGDQIFEITLPEASPSKEHGDLSPEQYTLLRFVSSFLQAPYLWGGRTPAGIDCSGLVQLAFKSAGIRLPRDASQQVFCGRPVDFIEETLPGDVAFFQNENGDIVHTGIVTAKGQIIHASGFVRMDSLDSTGIYNRKLGKYTHYLRVIKRLLQ